MFSNEKDGKFLFVLNLFLPVLYVFIFFVASSFLPFVLFFIFVFIFIIPILIYGVISQSLRLARKGSYILAVLGLVSVLADGYAISRFRFIDHLADLTHLGIMWPVYARHIHTDSPTYFFWGTFGTALYAVELNLVHDPREKLPKNPPAPGHEQDQGVFEYQHLIGHWYVRSEQF